MKNETEMLLQVWADVLRDVQNDKDFMQQTERAAQEAQEEGVIQHEIGRPACS